MPSKKASKKPSAKAKSSKTSNTKSKNLPRTKRTVRPKRVPARYQDSPNTNEETDNTHSDVPSDDQNKTSNNNNTTSKISSAESQESSLHLVLDKLHSLEKKLSHSSHSHNHTYSKRSRSQSTDSSSTGNDSPIKSYNHSSHKHNHKRNYLPSTDTEYSDQEQSTTHYSRPRKRKITKTSRHHHSASVGNSSQFHHTTRKYLSSSSNTSESESDYPNNDRPIPSYGSIVGQNIPQKLRRKILQDKFVEISQLLPQTSTNQSDEFIFKPSKDKGAKLVKNKKRTDISFSQWMEGFDIFIAVYIDSAHKLSSLQKLIRSLLTYKKEIATLYRMGYDWASFDRHFRKDREVNPCSWATVRHDLHMLYSGSKKHTFRSQPTDPNTNKIKSIQTRDGNTIPAGYCIEFHTRDSRCSKGLECSFQHKCPKCRARHPIYRACQTSKPQTTDSPSTNSTRQQNPRTTTAKH